MYNDRIKFVKGNNYHRCNGWLASITEARSIIDSRIELNTSWGKKLKQLAFKLCGHSEKTGRSVYARDDRMERHYPDRHEQTFNVKRASFHLKVRMRQERLQRKRAREEAAQKAALEQQQQADLENQPEVEPAPQMQLDSAGMGEPLADSGGFSPELELSFTTEQPIGLPTAPTEPTGPTEEQQPEQPTGPTEPNIPAPTTWTDFRRLYQQNAAVRDYVTHVSVQNFSIQDTDIANAPQPVLGKRPREEEAVLDDGLNELPSPPPLKRARPNEKAVAAAQESPNVWDSTPEKDSWNDLDHDTQLLMEEITGSTPSDPKVVGFLESKGIVACKPVPMDECKLQNVPVPESMPMDEWIETHKILVKKESPTRVDPFNFGASTKPEPEQESGYSSEEDSSDVEEPVHRRLDLFGPGAVEAVNQPTWKSDSDVLRSMGKNAEVSG